MKVHRTRAAYHRKAARDLRSAESRACSGLARDSRTVNPFFRGHVLGVSPLEEPSTARKSALKLSGAIIVVQPIAGIRTKQLQKIMDCHSSHQAVIGYGPITTAASPSPLGEPGAQAIVRELRHGFAVEVRVDDPFAAQAVWLRAQQLAIVDK